MDEKPAFDPSQPFEAAGGKPAFDPSQPFEAAGPDAGAKPSTKSTALPAALTDVWPEIKEAGRSALSKVGDTLNPFSDARHAAYERAAKAPSLLGTAAELGHQTLDTGAGLATLPAIPAAPLTGAARSLIGHPYSDLTGIPYEEAKGAVDTALMGLAPRGASPVGPRPVSAAASKVTPPTAEELKDAAQSAYNSPEVKSLRLDPASLPKLGKQISSGLTGDGFHPLLAPKTHGILNEMTNVPSGTPYVTADNMSTLRRMLGKAAETPDRTERAAARVAQSAVDDFMSNVPSHAVLAGDADAASSALQEARGNYAAASRSGRLDEALTKADRQAAKAGIGGNIENSVRQRIAEILNNPKKVAGYSAEEKAAMETIVAGTLPRNGLRVLTKILGGDNPLMAAIHAGLAFPTSGLSLLAPASGFILKKLTTMMTDRQVSRLDELIRSRAPLSRALQNAANNLQQFQASPNPLRYAAFFQSASALTNRLAASGIKILPGDLMRTLQSPGTSNADENQPNIPGPIPQQQDGGRIGQEQRFAHGGTVPHGAERGHGFAEGGGAWDTAASLAAKAGEWGLWGGTLLAQRAGYAVPAAINSAAYGMNAIPAGVELYKSTHAHPPQTSGEIMRNQRGGLSVRETLKKHFDEELPPAYASGGKVENAKVIRSFDVPYLAGSSNDNKTVFIDRRVPRKIKVKLANGKGYRMIDPATPLSIHERSEHRAMSAGKSYEHAHIENGTADERTWVERNGLDWKHYEEVMDGLLSHIEHEHPKRPPPALYTRPYPHDKAVLLKRAAAQ